MKLSHFDCNFLVIVIAVAWFDVVCCPEGRYTVILIAICPVIEHGLWIRSPPLTKRTLPFLENVPYLLCPETSSCPGLTPGRLGLATTAPIARLLRPFSPYWLLCSLREPCGHGHAAGRMRSHTGTLYDIDSKCTNRAS